MPDQVLLMMLRRATWQKAKAELLTILEFYYNESVIQGGTQDQDFNEMNDKIEEFIERTEEFIEWMEQESPIA